MGFTEAERICKNHPYHNQKQGVCPSCLRERLSQLYVITSQNKASMVALSCSSLDSSSPNKHYLASSSSNRVFPGHQRHQRNGSEALGSVSFRVGHVGGGGLIKKSRSSIGFVSRIHVGEIKDVKKKKGFWSKLLHLKEKKEVFVH